MPCAPGVIPEDDDHRRFMDDLRGADRLAELGRESHPNHHQPLPKQLRTYPQWEALGLEEMSSSSKGEARNSGGSQEGDQSTYSQSSEAGSQFSSDVSDTRQNITWDTESSESEGQSLARM